MSAHDDYPIKWESLFGHVVLNSWFEFRDGKFIGMGSSTTYDCDGRIVSHDVAPTGVMMVYE